MEEGVTAEVKQTEWAGAASRWLDRQGRLTRARCAVKSAERKTRVDDHRWTESGEHS
jgi:hypothetical protein